MGAGGLPLETFFDETPSRKPENAFLYIRMYLFSSLMMKTKIEHLRFGARKEKAASRH